jgi:DNA uptake protein ComE-like DNA-binding protein
MVKKALREIFLLPRAEQRALVLLSLLLALSLGTRVAVQLIPGRKPSGTEHFIKESQEILASMEAADSLKQSKQEFHAPIKRSPVRLPCTQPFDINSADSAMLASLPGIGPVFTGRIIRYRDLLGGYLYKDQLMEVYGMNLETLHLIKPCLEIDTSRVRKIMVNSAGFGEMLRHPYLEYEDVKALVNYREVTGGIMSRGEIHQHGLIPDTTLEKIGPYLDFKPQ